MVLDLPLPLGEGRGEGLARAPLDLIFRVTGEASEQTPGIDTSTFLEPIAYALTPSLSQREREIRTMSSMPQTETR